MRVCFFRHSLLGRGGDKITLSHAAYLSLEGHIVTVTTNEVDTIFPIASRIKIKPIRLKGKIGTILTAFFTKQDADVIIADIVPLLCLLYFRNRKGLVFFAQDYDESYYSNPLLKFLMRILSFFTLSILKIPTIAVSEELADKLKTNFNANAVAVRNGVDTNTFFNEPSASLIEKKERRKSILLLSRHDFRKGFDVAIDVIKAFKKRSDQEFEVWTVGETINKQIFPAKHNNFGYVDEKQLRYIMSSADLFLYPSRHEGFGLMVMEAFACGCPVVTTEAVPFAKNYVNAYVSKISDVESMTNYLREILSGAIDTKSVTENAMQFAKENSAIASNQKFEDLLLTFKAEFAESKS